MQGHYTIGTYAIREDDTCTFLAADFDGAGWQGDIQAYRVAARTLGIEVYVERSRSGNGAHTWIFFSHPVAATLARRLGTMIVARATLNRNSLSLETYDRFFPNQDFLPSGNLIALPLQRIPRDKENSVFLDDDYRPLQDQWEYMAKIKRVSAEDIKQIISEEAPEIM
ncbi:hypothetical protein L0156_07885 [bacterium]|nr:hypothetical protein [bacterium]